MLRVAPLPGLVQGLGLLPLHARGEEGPDGVRIVGLGAEGSFLSDEPKLYFMRLLSVASVNDDAALDLFERVVAELAEHDETEPSLVDLDLRVVGDELTEFWALLERMRRSTRVSVSLARRFAGRHCEGVVLVWVPVVFRVF